MGWLDGEVALVTGGGSGIGRAVVDRFVAEGARVVVADIDPERLASVRDDLGDKVATILTDVSVLEQNEAAVAKSIESFGKLDILVANAGIGDKFTELADIPGETIDDAYSQVFDVNVKGIILGFKAALPALLKTRGSIVVTLSNASFLPDGGGVMYVASKHAALGVVRQLAHEFAPQVRVNAVAPGATRTSFSSPSAFGESAGGLQASEGQKAYAPVEDRTPMDVLAKPEDHVAAYVLLASRGQSAVMTGTVIESDGGLGVRGLRRIRGGDDLPRRVLGEE